MYDTELLQVDHATHHGSNEIRNFMSFDPQSIERLSNALAKSLEDYIAPLRAEIARLEAEIGRLRVQIGGESARQPQAPAASMAAATLRAAVADTSLTRRTNRITTAVQSCQVPRCAAPVLAKELCETHYRIMRRAASTGETFDPKKQRPAAAREVARACGVADCTEAHYAKQLCRRHYMAARARLRNHGEAIEDQTLEPLPFAAGVPMTEPSSAVLAHDNDQDDEDNGNGSSDRFGIVDVEVDADGNPIATPTAEMVARVLAQYRGGLVKVADVLGRNKRSLMQLLDHLNLMQHAIDLRKNERRRILAAPLRERLSDLLFREKLLEDLDCLKDVDEHTRTDVVTRLATLARGAETVEDALAKLAGELGLEDSGMKRLIWRYDLRRQLRDMKLKSAPMTRLRH